jgi:hypothetical protein
LKERTRGEDNQNLSYEIFNQAAGGNIPDDVGLASSTSHTEGVPKVDSPASICLSDPQQLNQENIDNVRQSLDHIQHLIEVDDRILKDQVSLAPFFSHHRAVRLILKSNRPLIT